MQIIIIVNSSASLFLSSFLKSWTVFWRKQANKTSHCHLQNNMPILRKKNFSVDATKFDALYPINFNSKYLIYTVYKVL